MPAPGARVSPDKQPGAGGYFVRKSVIVRDVLADLIFLGRRIVAQRRMFSMTQNVQSMRVVSRPWIAAITAAVVALSAAPGASAAVVTPDGKVLGDTGVINFWWHGLRLSLWLWPTYGIKGYRVLFPWDGGLSSGWRWCNNPIGPRYTVAECLGVSEPAPPPPPPYR
jgi:hypothetical protein